MQLRPKPKKKPQSMERCKSSRRKEQKLGKLSKLRTSSKANYGRTDNIKKTSMYIAKKLNSAESVYNFDQEDENQDGLRLILFPESNKKPQNIVQPKKCSFYQEKTARSLKNRKHIKSNSESKVESHHNGDALVRVSSKIALKGLRSKKSTITCLESMDLNKMITGRTLKNTSTPSSLTTIMTKQSENITHDSVLMLSPILSPVVKLSPLMKTALANYCSKDNNKSDGNMLTFEESPVVKTYNKRGSIGRIPKIRPDGTKSDKNSILKKSKKDYQNLMSKKYHSWELQICRELEEAESYELSIEG